jgi:hypothetical protein
VSSDIQDPFAGADEADEFDTPQMEFVTIHDLKDRLCVINAKRVEVGKSKDKDKDDYEFVVADVIIVDGPTTDLITHLPFVAENMHLNAKAIVGQIKDRAGRNRPFLCRVDAAPSSYNKQVMAYGVRKHEVTDADKAAALPAWRKYAQDQAFA